MVKNRFYVLIVMLSLATLLLTACSSETDSTPAPDLQVSNAADARDAAITYLQKHEPQNAPGVGISWQEEDVTPPGWVGGVFKGFVSDEWTINVSYPVVALENTIYEVTVSSIKLGWHWKGKVDAYGKVTEVSAFRQMTKEESQRVAEEFLKNSQTFVFDGMDDTLNLVDTLTARCPYCWAFIFEFDSRHAGYGDRTGQMLAQVITPHRAVISVEQLVVVSAVLDERWNMLSQEMIAD